MENISADIIIPSINSDVSASPVTGELGGNNPTVIHSETDYEQLENKPQINDVTLIGNKSFDDLGLSALTSLEIVEMYRRIIHGE